MQARQRHTSSHSDVFTMILPTYYGVGIIVSRYERPSGFGQHVCVELDGSPPVDNESAADEGFTFAGDRKGHDDGQA